MTKVQLTAHGLVKITYPGELKLFVRLTGTSSAAVFIGDVLRGVLLCASRVVGAPILPTPSPSRPRHLHDRRQHTGRFDTPLAGPVTC